jgi:hypothetical protein
MARIWGSLNLLVFIKISSIIKPEKILLLKPVILRGDYRWARPVDVKRILDEAAVHPVWEIKGRRALTFYRREDVEPFRPSF